MGCYGRAGCIRTGRDREHQAIAARSPVAMVSRLCLVTVFETLEAGAGTHQEYAETLLQRGRPSATIGWSRRLSRDELTTLALSHELTIAERGDLAIGV